MRLAALLLILALPASSAEDPAVVAVMERLSQDPAAADGLAARVLDSRLGGLVSQDQDANARLTAIKDWVAKEPVSAARIAVGLAADEAEGGTRYEDALMKLAQTTYEENTPAVQKSIYGRLRRAASDSKLIKKQAEELSADERSEIMRTLFEGKGSQSERVLTQKDDSKPSLEKASPGPATAYSGYYDRLSGGNLRGYSPQLMSLQSALNARRPPGAPRLVETGKLDYATLSYPGHGLRYDLQNLDERLRRERIAQAQADKLPSRLARREALIAKARKAVLDFDARASKSRNPDAITKGLLIELGRAQKEASRWIAAAALEEELSRLEAEEGFLTPELLAAIDALPASEAQRAGYKKRGEELKAKYALAKSNAQKAQELLESSAWASSLAEVDHLVAANQSLRRNLSRDVDVFCRVPWRIHESRVVQARWREMLDSLALKWAPRTSFARGVALRRGRLSRYLGVFSQVAAGDLDAAARSFASVEPVGR